jgi:tripartite-type tricarboxylate transporter receptor subunit TctC
MKRLAFGITALLLGAQLAPAEDAVSFRSKSVTLIVTTAPGGGTDTSGRLIAQLLANQLPGKPSLIVRNIPGAEGITGMNYFVQQVVPDGLTLTMGSTTQADPLLYRKPQSQYDPTKFAFIGGVGRGGTVLVIRKDAEARLYDKNAAPAVMGALGGVPRSGMQMTAWGMAYLGWNAKWVLGYRGTNDLMVALDRGEIDMTSTANMFELTKIMNQGRFKIVAQSGSLRAGRMVPRAEFGNAPVFTDMMRGKIADATAQKGFEYWSSITSLDKWIALPPKTPDAYVAAYRAAYGPAFTSPDFVELGKGISEDFEPMTHEDVEFLVNRLGAVPPDAIASVGAMLRRQGIAAE